MQQLGLLTTRSVLSPHVSKLYIIPLHDVQVTAGSSGADSFFSSAAEIGLCIAGSQMEPSRATLPRKPRRGLEVLSAHAEMQSPPPQPLDKCSVQGKLSSS